MTSTIHNEVVTANGAYASHFGDKGKLALPPARQFAILTCMDARLDPAKYAGLAEGDAHVILLFPDISPFTASSMTSRPEDSSSPAPSAIFLPSSMTTTRSERRITISSLCSISRIDRQSFDPELGDQRLHFGRSVGFMPAVGSSSSKRRGLSASARAISTRRRLA
ncbi:hypothetical protein [Bradyrhizobium sp.]|uniref:hypothetical protein n=1 Tax=Bradyrhizobium sp. TaxID=376 RepID=UPI003C701369